MDLPNALLLLARDTDLLAVRPRGIAIAMNESQVIIRALVPKPYRWAPTFGDIISNDWFVGTLDAIQKRFGSPQVAEG